MKFAWVGIYIGMLWYVAYKALGKDRIPRRLPALLVKLQKQSDHVTASRAGVSLRHSGAD